MYVKPQKDARIPMPERGGIDLPATGAEVPENSYWCRRLQEKVVTRAKPPKQDDSPSETDAGGETPAGAGKAPKAAKASATKE